MSKAVYEWFKVAAQNNFLFGDGGMPEGMDRQQLNNSGRERMRAIREMYDTGLEFLDHMRNPSDGTAFTTTRLNATTIRIVSGVTDMSSFFTTDRRIRTYTASAVTDNLFVASVSYSNPNTDVVIYSAGGDTVTAGIDQVKINVVGLGRLAYDNIVASPFTIPAGLTEADFAAALATITAAGGGILLLLGDSHLLTSQHLITTPIWILGRGQEFSVTKAGDATNLASLFKISGVAARDVHFSNFTLDGNRANQTTGNGDGILVEDRASHVHFEDMLIKGTRRDGIRLNNSSATSDLNNISFRRMAWQDIGGDGVQSIDPQSGMYAIQAEGLTIDKPGQEQTDSAGIRAAGRWNLSNIDVTGLDLGGGNTQRGIWFLERLAIDPNPQDAHLCTLSGFSVGGSGGNSRGIECHGERITVANGTIKVSGGASRGVLMGGTLGQQTPNHNAVNNVVIEDANVGVVLESTASDIELGSGLLVKDCTTGVSVAGNDCAILGARITGGTTGVDVLAAANDCNISNVTFRNVTTDVADAGTGTRWNNNYPPQDSLFVTRTAGDVAIAGGPIGITSFIGLALPGLGGNGTRKFRLSAYFRLSVAKTTGGGAIARIDMHMGPAGGTGDPVQFSAQCGMGTAGATDSFALPAPFVDAEITPAAGDKITFSCTETGVAATTLVLANATDPAYCRIQKVND